MNEKARERLAQIQELIKQKDAIEKKLETLLYPEKEHILPPNFSMNVEVFTLVRDAGSSGIAKANILKTLQSKYPDYGMDRRKVASALAYLKNGKKQIELIGRGIYKAVSKIEAPESQEPGSG